MQLDTAFQMSASNIRFGLGVTSEVGMDLRDRGLRRSLLLMDPALASLPVGRTVTTSLKEAGIGFEFFDRISIEPTDQSFQEAARVASEGRFDSFVAVGGGKFGYTRYTCWNAGRGMCPWRPFC